MRRLLCRSIVGTRTLAIPIAVVAIAGTLTSCRRAAIKAGTAAPPASPPAAAAAVATPAPVEGSAADPGQFAALIKALAPEDEILSERSKRLTTVDAAFAWVRDNIGFESYDGILRGPRGTFHTHAGNALDRMMLLASILESHGVPVRPVTGHLPAPIAERLFTRIFESRPPRTVSLPGPVPAEATALKNRLLARAHHDFDVLQSALRAPVATSAPTHDDLIKEISAHAWLQAQVNGQWIDLDPSFPDATIGHAYAAVEQTYTGPPAALMQQVTVRLKTETLQANALDSQVVLEQSFPAYKLLETQVFIAYTAAGLGNIFTDKDVRQPALIVDGTPYVGKPIDFARGSAVGGGPSGSLGGVLDAFGGSGPAASGPAFVAEWLEFELAFPSGRREITRRVLVDRAGTAWRKSAVHDPAKLTPLARNGEGIVAAEALYNIWFSAGQHSLLGFATSAQNIAGHIIPGADPAHVSFNEQVWPLAIRDLGWLIASDHMIVPLVNDTPGLRFYADAPRIFVWSGQPDPDGKPGMLTIESDLRRDTLRAVARDPSLVPAIPRHKMWFGALEGAMEHELEALPVTGPSAFYVSTSSLAESGDVVVVTRDNASALQVADAELLARLKAAAAGGDTLVVPKTVLAGGISGWWQVSHETGDVRAVLGEDLNAAKWGGPEPGAPPGPYNNPSPGGRAYYYPYEEYRTPPPSPPKKQGGEFGEYNLTNLAIWFGARVYRALALLVVAVGSWAYVLFTAINLST